MRFALLLSLFTLSFSIFSIAQIKEKLDVSRFDATPHFIEMMISGHDNYFEIKKEYENYMKNHPDDPRSFNQYHRWAYMMEGRVGPDGVIPNNDQKIEEILKLKNTFNKTSTSSVNQNWRELGPKKNGVYFGNSMPGIGRINTIKLDPNNPNIIYVGSPAGGLWRSIDDGKSWKPLTDNLPSIGVSGIAIDHTNSNIIYIATGDSDSRDTKSIGIWKSADFGLSWKYSGLRYTGVTIDKLIMHPTNQNILFASSQGRSIYKTSDAGENWKKIYTASYIPSWRTKHDIEFKPGNPNIVYCISRTEFLRSEDTGESWEQITVPINTRGKIAVTPKNPEYVYIISLDGIYRSTDSGKTFSFQGSYPGLNHQIWYNFAFAVSPSNPEVLFVGELLVYISENGGTTFRQAATTLTGGPFGENPDYLHVDVHELIFEGETLYAATDGSISRTSDLGKNWEDLTNGIGVKQFYKIGSSASDQNLILAGAQDNGTSIFKNGKWYEWISGDGMESIIDYTDNNILYTTRQRGFVARSIDGGKSNDLNVVQAPGIIAGWLCPFLMDPLDPKTLYLGQQEVYKSTDGMHSWSQITNFNDGHTIKAMSIAKSNPNYIYLSKYRDLRRSTDDGLTWTDIGNFLPMDYMTISYIAIHPINPEIIAISNQNIDGSIESSKRVFISYDAGENWINLSLNLPNLPSNCLVFDNTNENDLYVGMDVGIYHTNNTMTEYEIYSEGMPNVIVMELEIFEPTRKLRAATYGRGLWEGNLPGSIDYPYANFTSSRKNVTERNSITFSDISSNHSTAWNWTFEGGTPANSTEQNPVVVYNEVGSFQVSLTVSNEYGTDTKTESNYITVEAEIAPSAAFSQSEGEINQGMTITFTDTSSNNPDSWNWIFEGGTPNNSNIQNPSVTYYIPGSYSVTLTASNFQGQNTLIKNDIIKVKAAAPHIEFESSSTNISVGESVNFFDKSDNNPTNWYWAFEGGDPETSQMQNPTITYREPGVFSVNLSASNEDGSSGITKPDHITVKALPIIANFKVSDLIINIGESVTFSDLSNSDPISWDWTFEGGDPETSQMQNPTITYHEPGVFSVNLSASNVTESSLEIKNEYIKVNPLVVSINKITPSTSNDNVKIYPNPNNGIVHLRFPSMVKKEVTVKLINSIGQKYFEKTYSASKNGKEILLDLGNISSGIYRIVIIWENQLDTENLIIFK